MKLRASLSLVSIVLGLAVFGFAAALASASPSTSQYDSTPLSAATTTVVTTTDQGTVAGVQGGGSNGPTSANAASPAQQPQKTATLPFTGQSLTWIVAAGVMLVLLGLALRRRGRSSNS